MKRPISILNVFSLVALPDYFDALNADDGITYQLTCIGGYAPVYIAQEVQGIRFTIGGGTLCSLPEDIDGDGQVTVLDVQADASAWRMANPAFPCDQNNDGDVDVQDIMLVAAAFGSAC